MISQRHIRKSDGRQLLGYSREASPAKSSGARIFAAVLAIGFLMFCFFVAIEIGTEVTRPAVPYYLLGICGAAVTAFLILAKRGGPWFTFFWLFTTLFMGFAPAHQLSINRFPSTTPLPDSSRSFEAFVLVLLGTIAFSAAYFFARRHTKAEASSAPSVIIDSRRLTAALLAALCLSLVYITVVGVGPLVTSRIALDSSIAGITANETANVVIRSVFIVVPATVIVHGWLNWRNVNKGAISLLVLASALAMFAVNPISSPRIFVGFVWGGFALAFLVASRWGWPPFAAMFASLFCYLFPLADFFRNGGEEMTNGSLLEAYVEGDYDAYPQILNALSLVEDRQLVPFEQSLGVMLFWLPRTFWPDKPADSGILLAEYRGYGFSNLSAPLWAEGILNAGVVGVLVLAGLYAVLSGRADRVISHPSSAGGVLGIAIMGAPYSLILLRGSLLQAVSIFVAIVVANFLASKFSYRHAAEVEAESRTQTGMKLRAMRTARKRV